MMIKILLLVLFLTAAFPALSLAQTKTITNSDLEKFRKQRLAAERDLRENYAEMGFPSPEELDKQIEESRLERAQWAENYRREMLERDRIQAESQPSQVVYYVPEAGRRYGSYYTTGFAPAYYYGYQYVNRRTRIRKRGPGYISNPLIRGAWLRQSAPMRNTYRGNFRNFGTVNTNRRRH